VEKPAMGEGAAAAPLVSVTRLTKVFRNGVTALQDLDLAIEPGAFLSILGPSGCGKSTLLRVIAGLTPPSSGEIAWRGGGVGRRGFVFQEPTLMPWATVWDNVYLPLRLTGMAKSAASERIAATLAAMGLEGFAQVYPRELSGGMKMRVSIARALVTEPELLLLDEPFAALDEITRFRLNEDLLQLWQRHHWTVVFVTHSVFESVFLSNRIVVMTKRPGRVAADVPIALSYPREGALRTAPAYADDCRRLSHILAEASA
jgi:NitT/TauT family transport system ATP-binding protein